MIFQKNYSIYFYISSILVVLYGLFALYVLVTSQWGQVVVPDDAFGVALGRRVLTARIIGIVTLLSGFVASLFYPKISGRFMMFAVIWSWTSFIDDTAAFQEGVLEATKMAGCMFATTLIDQLFTDGHTVSLGGAIRTGAPGLGTLAIAL